VGGVRLYCVHSLTCVCMDHRRRAWRAAADWDYRTDCVDAAKQEDGGAAAEQQDT
jgi:hypothetical protein